MTDLTRFTQASPSTVEMLVADDTPSNRDLRCGMLRDPDARPRAGGFGGRVREAVAAHASEAR